MIHISPGHFHLWFTFLDDIDEILLRAYRDLLPTEDRLQAARFHFESDRRRYLVSRALTRVVLSRYCPLAPQEWVLRTNAHGRPRVANFEGGCAGLDFNLSHTDGLVVLGLADSCALGVDTENTRSRQAAIDIAGHFFSGCEAAALEALPSAQRADRFFEYWTLKEAYIKARGEGLSIPLQDFGFEFPANGQVRFWISGKQNDAPSRWRFWQLSVSSEHVVAVCAERTGVHRQLIARRIVPLRAEGPIEWRLIRSSQ